MWVLTVPLSYYNMEAQSRWGCLHSAPNGWCLSDFSLRVRFFGRTRRMIHYLFPMFMYINGVFRCISRILSLKEYQSLSIANHD